MFVCVDFFFGFSVVGFVHGVGIIRFVVIVGGGGTENDSLFGKLSRERGS